MKTDEFVNIMELHTLEEQDIIILHIKKLIKKAKEEERERIIEMLKKWHCFDNIDIIRTINTVIFKLKEGKGK